MVWKKTKDLNPHGRAGKQGPGETHIRVITREKERKRDGRERTQRKEADDLSVE